MRAIKVLSLVAGVLILAGCDKEPAQKAATESSAPDAKPGLSVSGGKLVMPAVKGNPGAAYFTLTNGSAKAVHIAAIDVSGAEMAMIHETKEVNGHSTMEMLLSPEVPAHGSIEFSPGGKHVMVSGLTDVVTPGKAAELTITFDDGDKISAPLDVVAVGGG
ncbi:MAG: copper chaperone PCu(A)C [Novosphingobium sp.]